MTHPTAKFSSVNLPRLSNSTQTHHRFVGAIVDWNTNGYIDFITPLNSGGANCSADGTCSTNMYYASKCDIFCEHQLSPRCSLQYVYFTKSHMEHINKVQREISEECLLECLFAEKDTRTSWCQPNLIYCALTWGQGNNRYKWLWEQPGTDVSPGRP
jgi:hypothetical protein